MDELFAVTVVFNPHGFNSRIKLAKEFIDYMHFSKVKLVIVEIAFSGRPFEVTEAGNPWHVQLRSEHVLWHKERALNIGIQHLLRIEPNAEYVATLDADVRFTNPNWKHDTLKALHHYNVVQPYSEAAHLNYHNEIMWRCKSFCYEFVNKGYHQKPPLHTKYYAKGHPGLAWAWRISTLNKMGGLLDFAIAGSGDLHMANSMLGDVMIHQKEGTSQGFLRSLKRWEEKATQHIKHNIGFVYGTCMDYWHGRSEQRGYDKRWDIISFHQFDPHEDIYIAPNGLYAFSGNKHGLEHDLRLSTSSRNEDSID